MQKFIEKYKDNPKWYTSNLFQRWDVSLEIFKERYEKIGEILRHSITENGQYTPVVVAKVIPEDEDCVRFLIENNLMPIEHVVDHIASGIFYYNISVRGLKDLIDDIKHTIIRHRMNHDLDVEIKDLTWVFHISTKIGTNDRGKCWWWSDDQYEREPYCTGGMDIQIKDMWFCKGCGEHYLKEHTKNLPHSVGILGINSE